MLNLGSLDLPIGGLNTNKNLSLILAAPEAFHKATDPAKNASGLILGNPFLHFPPRLMHDFFDDGIFVEAVSVVLFVRNEFNVLKRASPQGFTYRAGLMSIYLGKCPKALCVAVFVLSFLLVAVIVTDPSQMIFERTEMDAWHFLNQDCMAA